MYGYKVSFEGFPKTIVACETTVTNYSWENIHPDNMLEISISKADSITKVWCNQKTVFRKVHALSCTTAEQNFFSYSEPETEVSITSVIVTFDKLNVVKKEFEPEDANDSSLLLLPAFLPDLSEQELNECNILLHKYIHYNTEKSASNKLMCCSVLYELLSKIDAIVRKQLSKEKEAYLYNQYYIKKVHSIVQKKYHTKLTASEIARELGISGGYFSSMYKRATGKTFSEYLLMTRMAKAEELLKNSDFSTSKIATAVGFENDRSCSKMILLQLLYFYSFVPNVNSDSSAYTVLLSEPLV
ncbi:MAG: helix-turn-helix domain-containing protein [Ruminococcaceae bacterium]|nr:helix-turn-helix domain-containing protein [Oscillospiraceae bacterium]